MSGPPSDFDLLHRWRSGDNAAGNMLVKRHFQPLHRFFAGKARGHEEDLLQQTLIACTRAKDDFRGEASFRAYLFALARFQLLTHYRKFYQREHIDFTTTSVCDLATSPSGAAERRQRGELLQQALARIPIDQRIALELTYWHGLSAPEVARVLEIAENTVYSRLHRAREHLREELARLRDEPGDDEPNH